MPKTTFSEWSTTAEETTISYTASSRHLHLQQEYRIDPEYFGKYRVPGVIWWSDCDSNPSSGCSHPLAGMLWLATACCSIHVPLLLVLLVCSEKSRQKQLVTAQVAHW